MEDFLAHVSEDKSKIQTIDEHLRSTRAVAGGYAAEPFKALAEYVCLIHDIGKFRDGFQARIKGISSTQCEHACIAAQEIQKRRKSGKYYGFFAPLMEYCTAGHHSGLQNGMPCSSSPGGSLEEALNRKADDIEKHRPLFEKYCIPPDDRLLEQAAALINKNLRDIPTDAQRKEAVERSPHIGIK